MTIGKTEIFLLALFVTGLACIGWAVNQLTGILFFTGLALVLYVRGRLEK